MLIDRLRHEVPLPVGLGAEKANGSVVRNQRSAQLRRKIPSTADAQRVAWMSNGKAEHSRKTEARCTRTR